MLLALAMLAASCTSPPAEGHAPPPAPLEVPTSLRVGIAEPSSIDPAHIDSPSGLQVVSQVFDGLVAYDPVGLQVVAAVAKRWDVSPDGTVITFHLRQGVTFHDGSAVRAQDFVFAWNRVADPLVHSPYAFLLEQVAGYETYHVSRGTNGLQGLEALSDRVLQVTLDRAWPGFVAVTAHPALSPVPPAASGLDYDAQPVGNGPYVVNQTWGLGQPIRLRRYDAYYGAPATIDNLEFDVFDRAEAGWPDFQSGDLDVAEIPPPLLPDAQSRYGTAGIVTLARLLYCGFNMTDEALKNPRIRQAFSLSLDRQAIAGTVYGETAVPASAIVPPSIPGGKAGACKGLCDRDVPRATALVEQLRKRERKVELDLTKSQLGKSLGQTIAAQAAEAGITVTPRYLSEDGYSALLQQQRQQVFCLVWDADTPRQEAFLDPLLSGTSPDNQSLVTSDRLDAALDAARATPKDKGRERRYAQAEELALKILPITPVVWFQSHLAVQRYVEGFHVDPLGLFDVATLRLATESGSPSAPPPTPSPSNSPIGLPTVLPQLSPSG